MKTWEIYHYTFGDVCDDSYYGKSSTHETIGFVTDTEENVKSLVADLNEKNDSFYATDESDFDYDSFYDPCDEDYFSYKEFEVTTIEEIRHIENI